MKERYVVTKHRFFGSTVLYRGRSIDQAIRIARQYDCSASPTIVRESDGAVLYNWHAAKPFRPANEYFWEKI